MTVNNKRRYFNLFILAWGSGFIYLLPYVRYQFYEPLQKALNVDHTMFGVSMSTYANNQANLRKKIKARQKN